MQVSLRERKKKAMQNQDGDTYNNDIYLISFALAYSLAGALLLVGMHQVTSHIKCRPISESIDSSPPGSPEFIPGSVGSAFN